MEMVKCSLKKTYNCIAILPTGGGKSAAFEVPAASEQSKTTLVFSPYISLSQDMQRRAQENGIKYITWKTYSDNPNISLKDVKLLFAIYDNIKSSQFKV